MREWYAKLPFALVALGLAGLGISSYLVLTHYGKKPIACAGVGECNYVNSSEYASVGGVPVSLLGLGMYVCLTVAAVYWSSRPQDETRMVAYWGLALAGAAYAGYLTYVELEILHAICVWCVASAVVLTLSLLLSTAALFLVPENADVDVQPRRRRRPA